MGLCDPGARMPSFLLCCPPTTAYSSIHRPQPFTPFQLTQTPLLAPGWPSLTQFPQLPDKHIQTDYNTIEEENDRQCVWKPIEIFDSEVKVKTQSALDWITRQEGGLTESRKAIHPSISFPLGHFGLCEMETGFATHKGARKEQIISNSQNWKFKRF